MSNNFGENKSGRHYDDGTSRQDDDEPKVKIEVEHLRMKKSISSIHCTAILVAVTGHVSVFVSPVAILRNAGSVGLSILIWLIGGIMNLCVCLVFTELGIIYQHAGGIYTYIYNVFGPLPGFLMLWGYLILIVGPFWAFIAYTGAIYITMPAFPSGCNFPENAAKILAAWILLTFVAVNCVYMKYVTKVQTILSGSKLIGLTIVIVAGIIVIIKGGTENFENVFENTPTDAGKISMAIFFSIFSYGGWQIVSGLMEEVKRPEKDVPKAVYLSFTIVIILYIATNIAYFSVLSTSEIMQSDAVAITFMQKLYPAVTPVISVLVGISAIGVLNASIMGHSRLLFAGARNKQAPLILGMLHSEYLTPWPAIFVVTVWSLVMLFSGGLTTMMEFIQVFSCLQNIVCTSALLTLRWKQPHLSKSYKINILIPLSQLLLNIVIMILCIVEEPQKMLTGILIVLAGIPVYWVGISWSSKPKSVDNFMDKMTLQIQKMLLVRKAF